MKIIGHRGARNEAPENTLEGFIHAYANGCIHFELDIQLSADQQLIVCHDKNLKRNGGVNFSIHRTSSRVLTRTDVRLNTPGWPNPCYVPRLEQVLDAVPNVKSWQFEVKTESRHAQIILARKLVKLILDRGLSQHAAITSSHKHLLAYIKHYYPSIQTGYVAQWRHNRPVISAAQLGCRVLVLNHKIASPSIIKRAHKRGIEVSCWTVNQLERARYLEELKVDSIITDEPSKLIAYFS